MTQSKANKVLEAYETQEHRPLGKIVEENGRYFVCDLFTEEKINIRKLLSFKKQ